MKNVKKLSFSGTIWNKSISSKLSIPCPTNANHDFLYYSMLFFTSIIILIAPRGKVPIVSAMLSHLTCMYAGRP